MKQHPDIFYRIQQELENLPGEAAHYEMYPKRGISSEELKNAVNYKTSAVLALMYEDNGTHMILTQRHEYDGKHSGQVSFPGGKMEKEDESILFTALRETQEEIGVHPDDIEILGKLTDVYIPVSKFLVHPFIGYHTSIPDLKREEKEVKEIFTFNIEELLWEDTLQYRDIRSPEGMTFKNVPCFILYDKVVWGATALMLNEIKTLLKRF
ncbi:MAG: CoA pyrophosphatase [Crocinitomicaceae bacterium]